MEYESETKSSTRLVILAQEQSLLPTPLPTSLLLLLLNTMSQHNINLKQVVCQQQEQLAALQAIIAQARSGGAEGTAALIQPNTQVEVVRLQEFNGSSGKVAGFITACKLYI